VILGPVEWTTAGLWVAVVVSGIYHGINPGMGWPLAVSAGLMGGGQSGDGRRSGGRRALLASLAPLAAGHFLAMTGILLPFAAMTTLVARLLEIQIIAALLVCSFGIYLIINRRHPRFLVRIRPTQLTLWSFAVAMAHGAGLMLVPIYLGLCRAEELDAGHLAAYTLISGNLITAIAVSVVHAVAMILSGGVVAFAVYEWIGPQFISKSWFNLDLAWAISLIVIGVLGLLGAAGLI
jgi:hypothetical protein